MLISQSAFSALSSLASGVTSVSALICVALSPAFFTPKNAARRLRGAVLVSACTTLWAY